METQDRPSPLTPRLENLAAITAEDVLLAYLATSKAKYCQLAKVHKALSACLDDSAAGRALESLSSRGLVAIPARTRCVLTAAGRSAAEARFGHWIAQGWSALSSIALPALALGLDPRKAETKDYLSRKENIESLTLGRVYGFIAPGGAPNRLQTRALLLKAVLAARFPECASALGDAPLDDYKPDVLAKALLLGLSGLQQGSLKEAETALTLRALCVLPGERIDLADAVVRAALSGGALSAGPYDPPSPPAPSAEPNAPRATSSLPAFANAVRELARTMETLPFTGRVAIAEVYDAGLVRGFAFGSLEEFKTRVAEACRAGLIDLERYDIAGALDPTVRDRSRTPLGRDERHFIVNEWV